MSEEGRPIRRLAWEGAWAELVGELDVPAAESEVQRLIDPASATRSVHWGNNYLYEAQLQTTDGEVPVVVKGFRNQAPAERLRRRWRGSKAIRSWKTSLAMREAGLRVPAPVAVVESVRSDGPSYFICELVSDAIESRYVFRAVEAGTLEEEFPDVDLERFLAAVGRTLRRMHDADFWHRDVSVGNVLLVAGENRRRDENILLLDLNRTRRRRLGLSHRMRDLCRLPIDDPGLQETLLSGYWGDSPVHGRWLYRAYRFGFRTKLAVKARFKGLRAALRRLRPRSYHVHIEPPEPGVDPRDRIVWDPLSDQPHQHAGRLAKIRVRVADAWSHLVTLGVVARSLPGSLALYRKLHGRGPALPVEWPEPGIALGSDHPWEIVESLLEGLGSRRVLLRVQPWEDMGDAESLARGLHAAGYEMSYALPQNRELVRDPKLWRARLEEFAQRFLPYSSDVHVGHAINRSKWGLWTFEEYEALLETAVDVLRKDARVRIVGPAVIDFEFHQIANALNRKNPVLSFDAVSSLLYVDRRGAPENTQVGFDTVRKVELFKAIVAASRHGDRPCWITEVNWPLQEGPHSPAGKGVAVDEQTQAQYLVRYYLLAQGTGLVDRVYWWQLVSRGYGLVSPTDSGFHRRPSYFAFSRLLAELRGSTLTSITTPENGVHLYRFEIPQGGQRIVGWSADGSRDVEIGSPIAAARDLLGAPVEVRGVTARLGSAPVYLDI